MPDTKITALTAIGANPIIPSTFPIPMVDLTDTSMAASGTTKKVTVNQILGAGGTATLASATISGAASAAGLSVTGSTIPTNGVYLPSANNLGFAYNSTLGMTLNATGLGVGTSPTYKLDVAGQVMRLVSPASTAEIFLTDSGTTNGYVRIRGESNALKFVTGNGTSATIDSSGNVGIGVTPSAGKGCLQLSSGINFPATQVASSDANTLDDYEEGTWTPSLVFGGANVGMTGTFAGRYTKVGRAVTINGIIALTAKGSSTGNAKLTGLPFISANAAAEYTAVSLRLDRISFLNVPCGYIGSNVIVVELENTTNAGTVTNLTDANFINTSVLILNCTYSV